MPETVLHVECNVAHQAIDGLRPYTKPAPIELHGPEINRQQFASRFQEHLASFCDYAR